MTPDRPIFASYGDWRVLKRPFDRSNASTLLCKLYRQLRSCKVCGAIVLSTTTSRCYALQGSLEQLSRLLQYVSMTEVYARWAPPLILWDRTRRLAELAWCRRLAAPER